LSQMRLPPARNSVPETEMRSPSAALAGETQPTMLKRATAANEHNMLLRAISDNAVINSDSLTQPLANPSHQNTRHQSPVSATYEGVTIFWLK